MDIEQVLLKAKRALEATQEQGYNLPGSIISDALADINECLGKLEYLANDNNPNPFWERNAFDEKFHQEMLDNMDPLFKFSEEQSKLIEDAFEVAIKKMNRNLDEGRALRPKEGK